MKFGQLIEYEVRNIFLEKSCTKYVGETSPGPFLKSQNWTYIWMNSLKSYTALLYAKLSVILKILILGWRPLAFTSSKAFSKKTKRSLKLALGILFLHFLIFVLFYPINWINFNVWFTSWDITQYVHCNCLLNRLWRHKFWN